MDRKNAVAVIFILFLLSSWLIGNIMNFQYDSGVKEIDLSYLLVVLTLLPFLMTGIIFYKGRTRMFLSLFSFALFWLIVPVFFQAFAVLYFGFIFFATLLIILITIKGYLPSKKFGVMTGIFLWLGAVIFYIYFEVYGEAMRSPLHSMKIQFEEVLEGPSYVWDEVGLTVESVGGPGVILLIMISILGMAFLIYRRYSRDHLFGSRKAGEKKEVEEQITSTVDKTITDLHQGKDVESAILRCYQEMCLILREEGVEDKDFMTPRELEKTALKKLDLPRSNLSGIREIFELVKYSAHLLGEEEKERALQDLETLKEVLR